MNAYAASNFEKGWYADHPERAADHAGYPFGIGRQFWMSDAAQRRFNKSPEHVRCAFVWRGYTTSAFERLSEVPAGSVLRIGYEDLARDPAAGARRLGSFLRVPDEDHARFESAFLKVRTDSIGRHRNTFSAAQIRDVEDACGDLLREARGVAGDATD